MNDADEWRAALYRNPAANRDDRPEPYEYEGESEPMKPLWAVEKREAEGWGDPLCHCGRNELQYPWDHQCRECDDDALAEEAVDRGRAGEWQ